MIDTVLLIHFTRVPTSTVSVSRFTATATPIVPAVVCAVEAAAAARSWATAHSFLILRHESNAMLFHGTSA